MFIPFFQALRAQGLPVSLSEFLTFLEALAADLSACDRLTFYHLARLTLIKDERNLDRFDLAFAQSFDGLDPITPEEVARALAVPPDWLRAEALRAFTDEERAAIQKMGGFEALTAALAERLRTQTGRHQGGNRWIGTGGTSPFGAQGAHPEGIRFAPGAGGQKSAVKVWGQRAFRDLDDRGGFGERAMRMALKRLRRWAREGAAEELDLPGTISATARQGWLDLQTRPERRNAVRLLLFLDIGGSMDAHVQQAEALFAAARQEFRHLDVFYFHNCLYEWVWREPRRRWDARLPTWDILRSYGPGYKCLFVGDAHMSPYEIREPGAANEHWNPEAGQVWLERVRAQWPDHAWINPMAETLWPGSASVRIVRDLFKGRMYPLTLDGLNEAMRQLQRGRGN